MIPDEVGAIRATWTDLGGWTGLRIDIAFGTPYHRSLEVQASPKGAKFQIVPLQDRWAAVVAMTPVGDTVKLTCYDGRWFVHAYDATGRYAGSIDLPTEE